MTAAGVEILQGKTVEITHELGKIASLDEKASFQMLTKFKLTVGNPNIE